jgi:amino acid adenylation domain-containing protein/non-ribosomal peptide synthase protein (TIGR01720 family)
LIGFFANTLVLRCNLSGNPTFLDLLHRVQQIALEAYEHQDVPFEMLVSEIQPERDMSRTPLFQVMFTVQEAMIRTLQLPGLTLEPVMMDSGTAKFDLTLSVIERKDFLRLEFEYNTDLFDRDTILRMAGHFEQLIREILQDPLRNISRYSLLTSPEKQLLLSDWVNDLVDYPWRNLCVHEIFHRRALTNPNAIAIEFNQQSLTYLEIDQKSDQLAALLSQLGVTNETIVGICVDRSPKMMIGMLGILKAGGSFLPLDPNYPLDRLGYLIIDSNTKIILTQSSVIERIPLVGVEVVNLDLDLNVKPTSFSKNGYPPTLPEQLAYVIYTSGSTGRPKGVMLSHSGLTNLLYHIAEPHQFNPNTRHLQFFSYSFDGSVMDILGVLVNGGCLVIVDQNTLGSIDELFACIQNHHINSSLLPPALLRLLPHEGLFELKTLSTGGESSPIDVWNRWAQDRSLVNLYGPTEATVVTQYYISTKDDSSKRRSIPIGKSMPNIRAYVLDRNLEPVPVGVPGELYITGIGLARGYKNQPQLTAAAFLPNPMITQEDLDNPVAGNKLLCLYKTGDRVRCLPDGNLEFMGRVDTQIKLRGFRIEIGEIESVIREHAAVTDTLVTIRDDVLDDKKLVAYIISSHEKSSWQNELRALLKSRLPDYMLPSAIVQIDSFPMTPNGKIDYKKLPKPELVRISDDSDQEAPQSEIENVLAGIWSELLKLERVGRRENFFELGGDSILSIQMISKARQAGIKITPRTVFQAQTIAELGNLADFVHSNEVDLEQESQTPVSGDVLLTPIQQYFFEQTLAQPWHWNQSILLEVDLYKLAGIQRSSAASRRIQEILEQTYFHLVTHHDQLRASYTLSQDGWQQLILPVDEANTWQNNQVMEWIHYSPQGNEPDEKTINSHISKVQASFNLDHPPLLRVVYFDRGAGKPGKLLFVAHHLIIDGISWRILLQDFYSVFTQLSSNNPTHIPHKTTSYKEWSNFLYSFARSAALDSRVDYWNSLAEINPGILPVDFPDTMERNDEASLSSVRTAFDENFTRDLIKFPPSAIGVTTEEVLLTALLITWHSWTGQTHLLFDTEYHGRDELWADLPDQPVLDISRTIGWFTSLYPVHLDWVTDNPSVALKRVKEQFRGIPDHGITYGIIRYLSTNETVKRNLVDRRQSEISFNYLGQVNPAIDPDGHIKISTGSSGPDHAPENKRTYLIDITGSITDGKLMMEWHYSNKIHQKETINRLVHVYGNVLQSIVTHCKTIEAGQYTPSDFTDIDISQEEVDRLMSEIGDDTEII